MNFESHRPQGYIGKGDRYLPQLAEDLKQVLIRTQESLAYNTLYLPSRKLEELATVLVEFAEDINNDIGIWNSLERYNVEFFGTPLPFILRPNEDMAQEAVNQYRSQHLLWVLYSELKPQLILSPTHRDLTQLAEVVSGFLGEHLSRIPRGSAVKTFLAETNKFGWDVKKKLIWLGTHSYLFRNSFRNYVEDHGGKTEIPIIDDFICQQTTAWSGLGAIDILAAALDISEQQRADLRSWYERHHAYYRILAKNGLIMEVMNTISDKPYTVRLRQQANQFKVGQIVLGSLVPWNGEWYWSGKQSGFTNITEDILQELKDSFPRQVPQIAYRYCDQLAEKAKTRATFHYHEFIKHHGDDLVIYPSGLSMAADFQKEVRSQWESQPKEVIAKLMEKHKLQNPEPSLSFPRDLIENENGVGVYYNQDEGQEVMTGFNDIVSGFQKQGSNLSEAEEASIRSFICSDSVSAKFVRRLVQEYGYESIESAFLIRGRHENYHLEYLLRRHKGVYYRNRYARIALV